MEKRSAVQSNVVYIQEVLKNISSDFVKSVYKTTNLWHLAPSSRSLCTCGGFLHTFTNLLQIILKFKSYFRKNDSILLVKSKPNAI